jgi:hypothetical protein
MRAPLILGRCSSFGSSTCASGAHRTWMPMARRIRISVEAVRYTSTGLSPVLCLCPLRPCLCLSRACSISCACLYAHARARAPPLCRLYKSSWLPRPRENSVRDRLTQAGMRNAGSGTSSCNCCIAHMASITTAASPAIGRRAPRDIDFADKRRSVSS